MNTDTHNTDRQKSYFNWLMRETVASSERRFPAELPLSIATDIGLTRRENQDRAVVFRFNANDRPANLIAMVCDGMGGMADGAICASLAISTFLSSYMESIGLPLEDRIYAATIAANNAVYRDYRGDGGTTLSALIIDHEDKAMAVNVGDSRIYSVIDRKLTQLTTDDTMAGQFPQIKSNNKGLLQSIGMGDGIEPHIISLSDEIKSSRLLITSDGVHYLDHSTMRAVINNGVDSAQAVGRLIELSKWCGGRDNASAIMINLAEVQHQSHLKPGEPELIDAFGSCAWLN